MNNFANILTFSRILMIPLMMAAFYLNGNLSYWLTFSIFVTAGITDFLDGYVARRFNQTSKLGTLMDPDESVVALFDQVGTNIDVVTKLLSDHLRSDGAA